MTKTDEITYIQSEKKASPNYVSLRDALIRMAGFHAGKHGGMNGGQGADPALIEPELRRAQKSGVFTNDEVDWLLAELGVVPRQLALTGDVGGSNQPGLNRRRAVCDRCGGGVPAYTGFRYRNVWNKKHVTYLCMRCEMKQRSMGRRMRAEGLKDKLDSAVYFFGEDVQQKGRNGQ